MPKDDIDLELETCDIKRVRCTYDGSLLCEMTMDPRAREYEGEVTLTLASKDSLSCERDTMLACLRKLVDELEAWSR